MSAILLPVAAAEPRPCAEAECADFAPLVTVSPPDFLEPLLAHPVAVFGGGVSGRAVRELLARLGVEAATFDERPGVGGRFTFSSGDARRHPLVVFSPGFAPAHAWLQTARVAGCACLGELDFASLFWRGRLIAVTGTNGKTTLTEFLAHALNAAGDRAMAAGNVGSPLSGFCARPGAADTIAVCEVSSFQAETLRYLRADAVLWTNFAEDHLERHPGLEAYFAAKWRLVEHSPGSAVFAGSSVQRFGRQFGWRLPRTAGVATENLPFDPPLAGSVFARYPQRENFLLAQAWWRHDDRPEAELYAAARTFKLGRHRLAKVGEIRGVAFWNDSKATNFHAVEAALATFATPVHLIAGGKAKGGDVAAFVGRIAANVRHAWLIGETRTALAQHCAANAVPHTSCGSLEEAVRGALGAARPGDHVVLSPGFASFDMFRDYADRGDQYEELVSNLGTTSTFQ